MATPRDDRQKDLLRPALEDIIDLGHPLIGWRARSIGGTLEIVEDPNRRADPRRRHLGQFYNAIGLSDSHRRTCLSLSGGERHQIALSRPFPTEAPVLL